jgi:hypothetical protein
LRKKREHIEVWENALPRVAYYSVWDRHLSVKTVDAQPRCLRPRSEWPPSQGTDPNKYERVFEQRISVEIKPVLDAWFRLTGELENVETVEERRLVVVGNKAYMEQADGQRMGEPQWFDVPDCGRLDSWTGNHSNY